VRFIYLFFLIQTSGVVAQITPVSALAQKVCTQINGLGGNKSALENKKVLVLNFTLTNINGDTIPSSLGVEFSKQLETLLTASQDKNKLKIVKLNRSANALMTQFLVPPNNAEEESKMYENLIKENHPDFYLSGQLLVDKDLSSITAKSIILESDKFQTGLQSKTVLDQKIDLNDNKEKLSILEIQKTNSIEELCTYITQQIKFQTKIKNISLSSFTYGETNLPTPFSKSLSEKLGGKLATLGGFNVSKVAYRGFFKNVDQAPYILRGKYYEVDNFVRLQLTLEHAVSENLILESESVLPLNAITNLGIAFKPILQKEATTQDEVIKSNPIKNEFEVNIYTNKGNAEIALIEGEQIVFSVIANKACFVRLIYLMADGSKVLLIDNKEIKEEQVGKVIEISPAFECSEPFGKEILLLNAQTQPFLALNTSFKNGYTFINEDIQNIVQNNRRGLKAVVSRAEKKLEIITYKK
jgi:hypothetical protein